MENSIVTNQLLYRVDDIPKMDNSLKNKSKNKGFKNILKNELEYISSSEDSEKDLTSLENSLAVNNSFDSTDSFLQNRTFNLLVSNKNSKEKAIKSYSDNCPTFQNGYSIYQLLKKHNIN